MADDQSDEGNESEKWNTSAAENIDTEKLNRVVFTETRQPQFIDLRLEFGDGEIFVIDGDCLLYSILRREDLLDWGPLGCSSSHVVYLFRKALKTLLDLGGNPQITFFKQMASFWHDTSSRLPILLRTLVVRDLRGNADVKVHTDFESVCDKKFLHFIRSENVLMVMMCMPATSSDRKLNFDDTDWSFRHTLINVLIPLYQGLGLSVAFFDSAVTSIASVEAFYLRRRKEATLAKTKGLYMKAYKALLSKLPTFAEGDESASLTAENGGNVVNLVETTSQKGYACLQKLVLVYNALRWGHILPESFQVNFKVTFGTYESGTLKSWYQALVEGSLGDARAPPDTMASVMEPQLFLKLLCFHERNPSLIKELLLQNEVQRQLTNACKDSHYRPEDIQDLGKPCHGLCVVKELVEDIGLTVLELHSDHRTNTGIHGLDNPLYAAYVGTSDTTESMSHNERFKKFEDKYHWHFPKKISPAQDRLAKLKDKGAQKYATYMSRYGASIEGQIETNAMTIVVENSIESKRKKAERKSAGKKSKAKTMIRDNIINMAKKDLKIADEAQLVRTKIQKVEETQTKLMAQLRKEGIDAEDDGFKTLLKSIRIKLLKLLIEQTLEHHKRAEDGVSAEVKFLTGVRKVVEMGATELVDVQKYLSPLCERLSELGFREFVTKTFPTIKVPEASDKPRRSITNFQMQHMGKLMELEKPKILDSRVGGFNPDLWQRRLFDAIDKRQSALIIAPTSSGKTYASYYCMEQILRQNDEDVVVYVAPTKALVNQVAATVYARFAKRKQRAASVHGVFTRDYRYNVTECQILVTVPACLDILLLSAKQSNWCQRIKYVIFDEVHNIGAEGDSAEWERCILLIRCPFLALSATVSNPEDLHSWFQQLETMKGNQDEELRPGSRSEPRQVQLVQYSERHADLVKQMYDRKTKELVPIHPLAVINEAELIKSRRIPRHITLSSKEAIQLYEAMLKVSDTDADELSKLEPSTYFGEKFLTRNDVRNYTLSLFEALEVMEPQALASLLDRLRAGTRSVPNVEPPCDFLDLLQVMKDGDMFPALFFVFERRLCELLPEVIVDYIEDGLDGTPEPRPDGNDWQEDDRDHLRTFKPEKRVPKQFRSLNINQQRKCMESTSATNRHALEFLTRYSHVTKRSSPMFIGRHNLGESDAEFVLKRLCPDGNFTANKDLFLKALQFGVSWHHAGQGSRRKQATEMLFRCGFVNLVVSTTTLAQGIHMPCKTVVFFHDNIFLNTLSFHQCSGRAGRRNFDNEGNVIFFDVPRSKVARLVTSSLPKILGNEPIRLSIILRLFIYISDIDTDQMKEAVSKCLCLLKCPLVLSGKSRGQEQAQYFFKFSVDLLAREEFLNYRGQPIGFAGLASHLFYHEPSNFALCHLLRDGSLHELCSLNEYDIPDEETMKKLLLVVSFLFCRRRLDVTIYEQKRRLGLFKNSLVMMEPLPASVKASLLVFNDSLHQTFSSFLKSIAPSAPQEKCLPLSEVSVVAAGKSNSWNKVRSVFAGDEPRWPTSHGRYVRHNELLNNTNSHLFTSFLPVLNLEEPLNRYVLDFFNHGSLADLERDNGVSSSEQYFLLREILLTIKVIATSLVEMQGDVGRNIQEQHEDSAWADEDEEDEEDKTEDHWLVDDGRNVHEQNEDSASEDEDETEDHWLVDDGLINCADNILVRAFAQLGREFEEKMNVAFGSTRDERFRKRGCYKQHPSNCVVCQHLVEGATVSSIGEKKQIFRIMGDRLRCETPGVIYVITCRNCRKCFVGESPTSLQKRLSNFLASASRAHALHLCFECNHKVDIQIVEKVKKIGRMRQRRIHWESRLQASTLDI